jgi:hypothetical protein
VIAVNAQALKSYVYVFAHNAKGYDGHFILKDIFKRKFDDLQIIMNGLKVLKTEVGNVHFIDSLSYFQQPLSSLPKSFGFENIVEKGFFPHAFNKMSNKDYVGVIPPIEDFHIQYMSPKSAHACKEWHKEMLDSNYNYVFFEELNKYCRNDVKILSIAIMEFRKLFINATEIDPITRNFTLASIGMEYFRAKILTENTIGITPINGYVPNRKQSLKGNLWLDWQQKSLNKIITREFRVGPYYADGYIESDRHIFEFFGCHFHGCEECSTKNGDDRYLARVELNNRTYSAVYRSTEEKVRYFTNCFINFL